MQGWLCARDEMRASTYCEEGRLSFEHVEKYRMLRHLIEFSSRWTCRCRCEQREDAFYNLGISGSVLL